MMSVENAQLNQLKAMIEDGKLTQTQMERKLTAAIESEYQNAQPDLYLIDACEDLLWEIHTEGKRPFVSAKVQLANAVHQNIREVNATHRKVLRFACACTALVVMALIGGALHWQQLNGVTTQDEQQYVIKGQNVSVQMIANSIAAHCASDDLVTTDWQEVIDYLGFAPSVPDAESLGMSVETYAACIEPLSISLYVQYRSETEEDTGFLYSCQLFPDGEEAFVSMEQDANGMIKKVFNVDVYISNNMGKSKFIWIRDTNVYQVVGNMSFEMSMNLIEQIIGGQ